MRSTRVAMVGIVLMAIAFCWFNTVQAGSTMWPSTKGEICLYNQAANENVRLAVMRTVGTHYIVHGFSESIPPDGSISLINGNAEVVGDTIYMHITGSGYDKTQEEAQGGSGWVELDASTLVGFYVGIGNHCNSLECGQEYESPQSIMIIPCQ
jgi:hypothetical protein